MNHALSRPTPLGGAEMRATVRELPRDGRGRAAFAACRRPCRVVHLKGTFGGSSTAEHSAVNRRVVGSNPTPRALRGPCRKTRASLRFRARLLRGAWSGPTDLSVGVRTPTHAAFTPFAGESR